MTLQFSTALRDARADLIESTAGSSATLEVRTGPQPANCAAADAGTLLATVTLPADWLTASSSGSKSLQGTWQTVATGTGACGHFRIKDGSSNCVLQGSVTSIEGNGDMTVPTGTITAGQQVDVVSFTIVEGSA